MWWHSSPAYWRLRDRCARTLFGVRRWAFKTFLVISSTKEKSLIGFALVKASTWNIFSALALVTLVEVMANLARQRGVLNSLSGQASPSIFLDLSLTLAGVGGALLGLYFTAMTVVLSGAYLDAKSDVRRLLVFDRAGSTYTALVSIMVIASLAVVGMDLVGMRPAVVTVLAITAIAALASASLLSMGARAFGFFDPVALGPAIRLEFNRWLSEATHSGLGSSDISFQTHYHRRAKASLDTLANLTDVVVRRSDRDIDSLVEMGSHLLGAWYDYAADKSAIPVNSRWFRRRKQHQEWRRETFGFDLALETGTHLPPVIVGDEHWVEAELAAPLGQVFVALAARREIEKSVQLMHEINGLLEVLGKELQIDEADILWSLFSKSFLPELDKVAGSPDEGSWALVATDFLTLAPVSIAVGVAQRIAGINEAYVAERVDALLRGRKRAGRGPAPLEQKLARLREGIEFEMAVEGRQVTPRWWLIEEASRSVVEFCCGIIPGIIDAYESQSASQEAVLCKSAKLQVTASFRGLELFDKLSVHAERMGCACALLSSARLRTSDLWPDMRVDVLKGRVSSLRSDAIRTIAGVATDLAIVDGAVGDEPDLFGRASAVMIDEVFRATLRGDVDQISAVFPNTFETAFRKFYKLMGNLGPNVEPHNLLDQILTASDPVADLLELSGYALLAGELGHPQLWQEIQSIWTTCLDAKPEGVTHVFLALRMRETGLGILRSNVARMKREMQFWRTMLGGEEGETRLTYKKSRQRHKSALVELTSHQSNLSSPSTAFATYYLAPKYSGSEPLPESVLRFQKDLTRELERRETN